MICLVAIRNIQWDQRGSMIGAGCGIVSGSIPAYEYGEAEAKIASVKAMVGIRG
jgi:isochorismate synthase EntC